MERNKTMAELFDIESFDFTDDDDEIFIFGAVPANDSDAPNLSALVNDKPVETLGGNDSLIGDLIGPVQTDIPIELKGFWNLGDGLLDFGDGRDSLKGSSDFTGTGPMNDFVAAGIWQEPATSIAMGESDDTIEGIARADDGGWDNMQSAHGIFGGSIDTGDGRDTVKADASVVDGGSANKGFATGLLNVELETGEGNDKVDADAHGELSDSGSARVLGISSSTIDTESGRDNLSASATVLGQDDSRADFSASVAGSLISTGDGNDGAAFTTRVELGDQSSANGVTALSTSLVNTGSGRDSVDLEVDVTVGAESQATGVSGINEGAITTGNGDDEINAVAKVTAGANSFANDVHAIHDTMVEMGDGRDTIEATSIVEIDASSRGFGNGIYFSEILTGEGADKVIATGADVAIGDMSAGIRESLVDLGAGNDLLVARGASAGVLESHIFGGEGDDVFDIGSGTGSVDGGADDDLLILSGESDLYDFAPTTSPGLGLITGQDVSISVENVEQFQFDDGTFDFGDLF